MKKIIALMISIMMILSLMACGSETNEEENIEATTDVTEDNTVSNEEESDTKEDDVSTEAESDMKDSTEFDTGWAGSDYEMLIPEPPFACEVEADNGSFTIRSTDVDELSALSLDDIVEYCETLKNIGFSESLRESELETGRDRKGYEFYGEQEGSCVTLMDDGAGCMIMLIVE